MRALYMPGASCTPGAKARLRCAGAGAGSSRPCHPDTLMCISVLFSCLLPLVTLLQHDAMARLDIVLCILQEPGETLNLIVMFAPPGPYENFFRTVSGLGHDHGSYKQVRG